MPVEIATSGLHGIYPYRQMSVYESGSSNASARSGSQQEEVKA
jgi:hypothetical protein